MSKQAQIKLFVDMARECSKSARRSKRNGLAGHAEWNQGRASSYLHAARIIKGATALRYLKKIQVAA
jgi:hypothetical protein